MALVGLALKRSQDKGRLQSIISEYWKPTQEWRFWEYLSRRMKIVEIVLAPNTIDMSISQLSYASDCEQAARVF
jgi:hypothetical protein